jgi:hypothetical protein
MAIKSAQEFLPASSRLVFLSFAAVVTSNLVDVELKSKILFGNIS